MSADWDVVTSVIMRNKGQQLLTACQAAVLPNTEIHGGAGS